MTTPENRRDQGRHANGRFAAGLSGNPGGRPKEIAEIRELARAHTAEALGTLAAIMHSTDAPPGARIAAANALLDRGWGRPTQPLAGDDSAPPVQLSREERSQAAVAAIDAAFGVVCGGEAVTGLDK